MSVKQTWLQLKHMFWLARFWMTCQGTRNNDFEHDIYFKRSFKLILSILTLNLEFLHAQHRGLGVLLRLFVCKCVKNSKCNSYASGSQCTQSVQWTVRPLAMLISVDYELLNHVSVPFATFQFLTYDSVTLNFTLSISHSPRPLTAGPLRNAEKAMLSEIKICYIGICLSTYM